MQWSLSWCENFPALISISSLQLMKILSYFLSSWIRLILFMCWKIELAYNKDIIPFFHIVYTIFNLRMRELQGEIVFKIVKMWKHSRSNWAGFWKTWSSWRYPRVLQGRLGLVTFNVSFQSKAFYEKLMIEHKMNIKSQITSLNQC